MSLFRTLVLALCAASAAVATPALARPSDQRFAGLERPPARPGPRLPRPARGPLDAAAADRAARVIPHGRRRLSRPGDARRHVRMKFLDAGKVIWVDVDPGPAGSSASRTTERPRSQLIACIPPFVPDKQPFSFARVCVSERISRNDCMRVLIVEDEPNLGRQLRSTLEGARLCRRPRHRWRGRPLSGLDRKL